MALDLRLPAFAAGALLLAVSPAQATHYVFTTLTAPGAAAGDGFRAVSINNAGQILLQAINFDVAFNYVDVNGVLDLHSHAYTVLPDAPGADPKSTQGSAINNHGQIVGFYHPAGGYWQGFSYAGGVFTPLNAGDAAFSVTEGVNDLGHVVGAFGDTLSTQGYFYASEHFTPINGAPHPPYSAGVTGLNNADDLVGVYGLSDGYTYDSSFLFSGGVFTSISVPGEASTHVSAINNRGMIVGSASNADFLRGPGFIDDHGVISIFDFPGAAQTLPYGVNDLGQIVGQYVDANGNNHAFLASPVPEPATWTLLLAGFGGLGWALRRKGRTVPEPA